MPKMLVIVHSSNDSSFLAAFFKKHVPNLELICLPLPQRGISFAESTDLVFSHDLPDDVDIVIVESNYGIPSDPRANTELIQQLLATYPKSIIVAHSSTMHSLTAALEINNRITIMGKGNVKPEDCDTGRIHSLTTLKKRLTGRVEETNSLTFAYDLSIALTECTTTSHDDKTEHSRQHKASHRS
jgi:hypothetical protein